MYKLNPEIVYPLEGDKDVQVHVLLPSYDDIAQISSLFGKDQPSDGPQNSTAKSSMEFLAHLMKRCIVKVEGIEINGQKIETGEQFLEKCPSNLVAPVSNKILELNRLSLDDKKKSA